MKLATAGNTIVPAYLALIAKGYDVSRTPADRGPGELWFARAAGREFAGEDLLSVLGLVALFEARGAEWRASDEQIDDFIAEFGE